ncbi:Unknown protein [Striga hermonthica]|uniref:Uncharacterized protein n=1 Tax=Striga hermonthica TaxID=68872 RepID=A0A9N7N5L9_STRHE|nr:Unknown protein [Striga hermonthica]
MNTNISSTNNNIDTNNIHLIDDNYVGGDDEEESGWTAYLEDFSSSKSNVNGSFIMSSSPSMVSDAAWHGYSENMSQFVLLNQRLNFNNMKRSKCNNNINQPSKYYSSSVDDLEDTASSPVNSPKVSSLKQMEMINRQRVDNVVAGDFLEKQAGSSIDSEDENNVVDSENTDHHQYVELRQKGLCLVPISAFIDYFR